MNRFIKAKGFTVLELIFVMIISVVLIGASIAMISVFAETAKTGRLEATAQSEIRVTVDTISTVTKQASAMFIMPKDTLNKALTKDWNYIGVKVVDGKSRVMHYVYDEVEKKHMERILCDAYEGVTYKVLLGKELGEDEKILEYAIVSYRDGEEISTVTSKAEALNSLQLIDKNESHGFGEEARQVLAYRSNNRKLGDDVVANIVVVVDSSGSMSGPMLTGSLDSPIRMDVLYDSVSILLDELNKSSSVNLAVVSFGSNIQKGLRNPINMDRTVSLNKFYPLAENIDKFKLLFDLNVAITDPALKPDYAKDIWKQIQASGMTNLSDGLRVGHVLLDEQSSMIKATTDKTVIDYLVLFVDGDSNVCFVKTNESGKNELYLGKELHLQDSNYPNYIWLGTPYNMTYADAAKLFARRYPQSDIKTYLVGVLDDKEFATMNYLVGPDALDVEKAYNTQDADSLKETFTEIGTKIIDDLWFISGPEY